MIIVIAPPVKMDEAAIMAVIKKHLANGFKIFTS